VRPDSQAVYVLNRQTSDVTVVDANTGRVLEKIATDGSAVYFLPAAGIAFVIDGSVVHAIDLATHKKLDDLANASGYYFSQPDISGDGRSAVINGGAGVLLINGAAGRANGKVVPFKRVGDIDVDWN
jgi:YVTN family beta-propeller protein